MESGIKSIFRCTYEKPHLCRTNNRMQQELKASGIKPRKPNHQDATAIDIAPGLLYQVLS